MSEALTHCSFCDKHRNQLGKLIVSHKVAICNECIDLCSNLLKNTAKTAATTKKAVPDPRDIRDYLDERVIGQDRAKIILSVAIANHYKRINNLTTSPNIDKGNILMIGPTGTGKTLLAQSVAEYLDVPFVVADATTLTEAGYVGEDVENIILRLLRSADFDVEKAQLGIIYIDEIH